MMTFKLIILIFGLISVAVSVLLYLATERNRQYVKMRRRKETFRLDRHGKRRRGIRIER